MGLLDFFGQIGSSIIGAGAAKWQQSSEQKFNAAEAEKARQFNADEAEKSRDWQTQEREATQDWNLEQWNRENEYNSPEQQLKRAIAAGINPNVAIQGITGNSNAGTVRSTPQSGAQASGPAASGPSVASTIGELLGNSVNSALQAAKTRSETTGIDIDNEYKPAQYKAELKKLEKETDKLIADTDMSRQQTKNLKQTFDRVEKMTPLEIDALSKGLTKMDEEINLLREQQKSEQKDRELTDSTISLQESEKDLNAKEGKILDEELIIKQAASKMAEATGYVLGASDIYNLYMAQKKGLNMSEVLNGYVQLKITDAGIDAVKQEYINERDQFWRSKYSYWFRPDNAYQATGNALGTLFGAHGYFGDSKVPGFFRNAEGKSAAMVYGNDDVVRIGPYFYKRMEQPK